MSARHIKITWTQLLAGHLLSNANPLISGYIYDFKVHHSTISLFKSRSCERRQEVYLFGT